VSAERSVKQVSNLIKQGAGKDVKRGEKRKNKKMSVEVLSMDKR
jgi:hypothetical protein